MSTPSASILLDPAKPVTFTPHDQLRRPVAERITYTLRVPNIADRAGFRTAVLMAGGVHHTDTDLLECLRKGIEVLMAESDEEARAPVLQAIADHQAAIETFRIRAAAHELLDPAAFAEATAAMTPSPVLEEVQLIALGAIPLYARMVANRNAYRFVRGMVACRMFLAGWSNMADREGDPVAFSRPLDGDVPDDLLSLMPDSHIGGIGAEIERLCDPQPALRKNSPSPSGTASSPATSKAARKQPRKTRSKGIAGTTKPSASPG